MFSKHNIHFESPEKANLKFIRKFYFYIGLFPDFDNIFTSYKINYTGKTIQTVTLLILIAVKFIYDGTGSDPDRARVYLSLAGSVTNFGMIIQAWIQFSTSAVSSLGKIFRIIQEVDIIFFQLKQHIPIIPFKWLLIFLFFNFTTICLLGSYAFKNIPIAFYIVGGVDQISILYVAFINVLIVQILIMAYMRFKGLNNILIGMSLPEVPSSCMAIDAVMTVHNKLANLCCLLQEIFSWHFVLFIFHMMFFMLSTLQIIFGGFEGNMAATLSLTLSLVLVQGIILALLCNMVTMEGMKTGDIMCDYVNAHGHSNSFGLGKMNFFLQQARQKIPQFSAASFVNMDNSLIFTFINLTATYVIVLVQFRNP